ncbi:FMN-dependent NADH-azoreductase [Paenibacillus sp. UNCCL117]|uniref:FMN-dependent NADH-azoreductase n=1 Tax=unclassified Paenibacillus TaxID=185978 RepID=UPI0008830A7F|nr:MULTISPECIES: NAD(P)H-dependent oxidoreductase [unclassified Paenibacillus]SDC54640.1 FMN-dependent NADH-azoreductase [Paenibacillus sp. cl123]SFW11026.1 FMN-dependent NADH-azoreductase [Paenibacillus sp. UNCCL117]
MEKLLVINAHPKVEDDSSVSLQVLRHFLENYSQANPEGPIEQIDLYREYVPCIDRTFLSLQEKKGRAARLTEEEQALDSRMSEILRQFKSAGKYVIAMPLHNFNVPSKLKDYMDNILIAKETFAYTDKGSVGLLNDGRHVLVIQASDGIYTNQDWYTEVEYSHKFLQSMFSFMGVDYQIIRAQGNYSLTREEVLAKAFQEAESAAVSLASRKSAQSV